MTVKPFDPANRAARERRRRAIRRQLILRRVEIGGAWLLLAMLAVLIGTGAWLMASK